MRKTIMVAIATGALMLGMPLAALAHPPCNDADGDGSPSGREYGRFHISSHAQEGGIGGDGHKPGTHHGFSLCNGAHDR